VPGRPPQAERLGDTKQSVRQKSCDVLVQLLHMFKADALQERLTPYWEHKNWRMRHGLLQVGGRARAGAAAPEQGGHRRGGTLAALN
jgi:hypothetical protein